MPATLSKIVWSTRAKVIRSEVSTRRQFKSECGHYALDHAKYDHPSLRPRWRLLGPCPNCDVLVVLSSHRTRAAAEKAANRHRRYGA